MITIAIGVFIPFHPGWYLPRGIKKGEMYNAADFVEVQKPSYEPKKTNSDTSKLSETSDASTKPSVASSVSNDVA